MCVPESFVSLNSVTSGNICQTSVFCCISRCFHGCCLSSGCPGDGGGSFVPDVPDVGPGGCWNGEPDTMAPGR